MSRAGTMALAALAVTQTGCIVVGYRSGGGWFMWPGGLGLILIVVIFLMLFLRRGRL